MWHFLRISCHEHYSDVNLSGGWCSLIPAREVRRVQTLRNNFVVSLLPLPAAELSSVQRKY